MDDIKTSQKSWSLTEGDNAPGAPAVQYGSESTGAPGPVTQPIKGEINKVDTIQTSQQRLGQHHTPES